MERSFATEDGDGEEGDAPRQAGRGAHCARCTAGRGARGDNEERNKPETHPSKNHTNHSAAAPASVSLCQPTHHSVPRPHSLPVLPVLPRASAPSSPKRPSYSRTKTYRSAIARVRADASCRQFFSVPGRRFPRPAVASTSARAAAAVLRGEEADPWNGGAQGAHRAVRR